MGKWLFEVVLLHLTVIILMICGDKNAKLKSCETPCSTNSFPHCGTWLHYDNGKSAAGVYLLGDSYANLTCLVHSLPKPSVVDWLMKTDSDSDPTEVTCTSMRTVTDCSYNDIGEHKVRSTCLLKLDKLDLTANYFCRAEETVASKPTLINVFGIGNITVEQFHLSHGEMGVLNATICANPRPDVIWVNEAVGLSIATGHNQANYSALPLHHLVTTENNFSPAVVSRFCYVAKLFIREVRAKDDNFILIASNIVDTKTISISATVHNIPPPPISLTTSIHHQMQFAMVSILLAIVI